MRGIGTLRAAIAAFIMAAAPAAGRAADHAGDVASILAIERIITTAPTITPLLPYLAKDMVFDDLAPGRVLGAAAYIKDVNAQFAAATFHVTVDKMHAEADGDLGFAYSIQNATIITRQNQSASLTFRQVDCYRKTGGKWLLVYQNLSVPFDRTTGKAVLNAAP